MINHNPRPESLPETLESWKEIAQYLDKGITTVRRWEREEGMPVRRLEHARRGSVVAYKHELDEWLRLRISDLPDSPQTEPSPVRRRWWLLAVAALLIAGSAWRLRNGFPFDIQHLVLTAYPGLEASPSFAPDGKTFVFVGNGGGHPPGSVFVKPVDREPARFIYSDPAKYICCAEWSPAGGNIAISYRDPEKTGYSVALIDPSGQWIRELGRGGPGISWRADGKALLYSRTLTNGAPLSIVEHDIASGRIRPVSFPPPGSWGDILGVPSPDGSRIALTRYLSFGKGDIYVGPYGRKETKRLTRLETWVVGADWLPDGNNLVFGWGGIFLLDASGLGSPQVIPGTHGSHVYPAVARLPDGVIRIGYARENWNLDLTLFDPAKGVSIPVARSTRGDETPDIDRSGRLVFMSSRSGSANLWVCDAGCEQTRQITRFHEPMLGMSPRWSADGARIVYAECEKEGCSLHITSPNGERDEVIATGFEMGDPSFSADGRFVYFRSTQTGQPEIWKMRADGAGDALRITQGGGALAAESDDGKWLYLTHSFENAEVMRRPVDGGPEEAVPGIGRVDRTLWRPAGQYIYYWDRGRAHLRRLNLRSGESEDVLTTAKDTSAIDFSVNGSGVVVWSHSGPVTDDLLGVDLHPRPFWKLW